MTTGDYALADGEAFGPRAPVWTYESFSSRFSLFRCSPPKADPPAEKPAEEPPASMATAFEQPRGLVRNEAGASPGYVMFAPFNSDTLYLVDLEGRVVHTWKNDKAGDSIYLQDDGSLFRLARIAEPPNFRAGGVAGYIQKLSWEGERPLGMEDGQRKEDTASRHPASSEREYPRPRVGTEVRGRREGRGSSAGARSRTRNLVGLDRRGRAASAERRAGGVGVAPVGSPRTGRDPPLRPAEHPARLTSTGPRGSGRRRERARRAQSSRLRSWKRDPGRRSLRLRARRIPSTTTHGSIRSW